MVSAGLANSIPMGSVEVTVSFALAERPSEEMYTRLRSVSADYFKTMGMTLRSGRSFTPGDVENATQVAIVNEAFARKYWLGRNAVGQRFANPEVFVVGVIADAHSRSLSIPATPELFRPYRQFLGPAIGATLVVRTEGEPERLASSIRQAIHADFPDQPVADVATMESRVADSIGEPRLYTALLAIFAAVALTLTAIGIYGVMAYSVDDRRREFGIRMALGARPADVLGFVMKSGMVLAGCGVALGVAGAWAAGSYLGNQLYEVTPRDPVAFAVAPVLMIAIAALACYVPARRATGVDPNVALRQD